MRVLTNLLGDHRPLRRSAAQPDAALAEAAAWLARAQDATPDDGVSAFYDVDKRRWTGSYPETTGYIIPTLYDYAAYSGKQEYRDRATRMTVWETELQLSDGGVRAGTMDAKEAVPTIFNTGQVLFGWARAFEETGDPRFRDSLQRACDWLLAAQDEDGAWRRYSSPFAAHQVNTYNTRVAYGLALASQLLDEPRYAQAAKANVQWALTQAQPNGWLNNNDLEDNERPLTHTIGYAIRGIFEVGKITGDPGFQETATRMANAVAVTQRDNGALPGRLDRSWQPAARWSCLTGNVQMASVWLKLAKVCGETELRAHAERATRFTARTQDLRTSNPAVRGAIAGSYPRSGGYMRRRYPNWATKFFMDALMGLQATKGVG